MLLSPMSQQIVVSRASKLTPKFWALEKIALFRLRRVPRRRGVPLVAISVFAVAETFCTALKSTFMWLRVALEMFAVEYQFVAFERRWKRTHLSRPLVWNFTLQKSHEAELTGDGEPLAVSGETRRSSGFGDAVARGSTRL